jgi:hypothetical protein
MRRCCHHVERPAPRSVHRAAAQPPPTAGSAAWRPVVLCDRGPTVRGAEGGCDGAGHGDGLEPVAARFHGDIRTRPRGRMSELVDHGGRDRSVEAVAAVSLAAGLACTLAPATTARLAGIDATPGPPPGSAPPPLTVPDRRCGDARSRAGGGKVEQVLERYLRVNAVDSLADDAIRGRGRHIGGDVVPIADAGRGRWRTSHRHHDNSRSTAAAASEDYPRSTAEGRTTGRP